MERTGSLPIMENSRIRLVIFENFRVGETGLDEVVCIILLEIEIWAACAAQIFLEKLLFQVFSIGNFIGEFIDVGSLVLTTPGEIVIDQVGFHQFRVGKLDTIDCRRLIRMVFRT